MMDFSNLSKMIDQVGKDKGIEKQLVVDAVIQGLLTAARKKYGTYREIEAQYNEDSGEVELYQFKEVVADEDWADSWKKHYKPVRLGERILVRPLWIDVDLRDDDIEIALDPGMAFGTGTHPTTQLCLKALERIVTPNIEVLDLGCGSGILSIATAKLGAKNIIGFDVEARAIEATIENAQQNGVADKIEAYHGGLDDVLATGKTYDLVVVNILARIIMVMCEQSLGETVRVGGKAIFSGIIEEQLERFNIALRKTGLEPTAQYQQGDWFLIEAERAN